MCRLRYITGGIGYRYICGLCVQRGRAGAFYAMDRHRRAQADGIPNRDIVGLFFISPFFEKRSEAASGGS